jgi:hypothetical protein
VARLRTVRGKSNDPFDAYEWMDALHQKFDLHPLYFFLVAETKGKYDKNTNIHNPEFQQLIKTITSKYQTGIHPSWFSGDNPALIEKEKQWLENISKKRITSSRQHYLRFSLPLYFSAVIKNWHQRRIFNGLRKHKWFQSFYSFFFLLV